MPAVEKFYVVIADAALRGAARVFAAALTAQWHGADAPPCEVRVLGEEGGEGVALPLLLYRHTEGEVAPALVECAGRCGCCVMLEVHADFPFLPALRRRAGAALGEGVQVFEVPVVKGAAALDDEQYAAAVRRVVERFGGGVGGGVGAGAVPVGGAKPGLKLKVAAAVLGEELEEVPAPAPVPQPEPEMVPQAEEESVAAPAEVESEAVAPAEEVAAAEAVVPAEEVAPVEVPAEEQEQQDEVPDAPPAEVTQRREINLLLVSELMDFPLTDMYGKLREYVPPAAEMTDALTGDIDAAAKEIKPLQAFLHEVEGIELQQARRFIAVRLLLLAQRAGLDEAKQVEEFCRGAEAVLAEDKTFMPLRALSIIVMAEAAMRRDLDASYTLINRLLRGMQNSGDAAMPPILLAGMTRVMNDVMDRREGGDEGEKKRYEAMFQRAVAELDDEEVEAIGAASHVQMRALRQKIGDVL